MVCTAVSSFGFCGSTAPRCPRRRRAFRLLRNLAKPLGPGPYVLVVLELGARRLGHARDGGGDDLTNLVRIVGQPTTAVDHQIETPLELHDLGQFFGLSGLRGLLVIEPMDHR
jgi:hypothetical protein